MRTILITAIAAIMLIGCSKDDDENVIDGRLVKYQVSCGECSVTYTDSTGALWFAPNNWPLSFEYEFDAMGLDSVLLSAMPFGGNDTVMDVKMYLNNSIIYQASVNSNLSLDAVRFVHYFD